MATSLPTYTGGQSSLVPPSGVALTDALIVGSKWGTGPAGTGATVTFSFPTSVAVFDTRPNVPGNYNVQESTASGFSAYLAGFSAFPQAALSAGREVLAAFARAANLTFTEVAADSVEAGVLRFALTAPPSLGATTYGVSWFPQDFAGAGDTWMNAAFLFPEGWTAGTQNFLTLLHEAGHALGLKHPHDGGFGGSPGWPSQPVVLPFTGTDTLTNESTQSMVMAYNDIPGLASVDGLSLQSDFAPTTLMRYDIAALQYLYGPNTAYNAGNTVYVYDGNARYNQTIWDAGGNDTIQAVGARGAIINLAPGTWSALGMPVTFSTRNADLSLAALQPQLNDPATVFIYDTVVIENAIGGSGNDILSGNAVANRLEGGLGNDTLDGGAGIDTAVFAGSRAAYTLAKTATGYAVAAGELNTDTLVNIERLAFGDMNLAIDILGTGAAGTTAKIIGGVFGKQFLSNPNFVGIGLNLLDGGMSYADLVGLAVGTELFAQLAGSRSNTDFVKSIYKNVVGADADAGALSLYVGLLDRGEFTQSSLAFLACETDLNKISVDLVGLANTGIGFVPGG